MGRPERMPPYGRPSVSGLMPKMPSAVRKRKNQRGSPMPLSQGQTDADPVGDAALVLTAARCEVTRLEKVEAALSR